jgi:DNA-binding HxlR family transcriptional regulator
MEKGTFEKINFEVRLQALEELSACTTSIVLRIAETMSAGAKETFFAAIRRSLENITTPELSPTLSDLVSAEFTDAVERLLRKVDDKYEKKSGSS